MPNLITLASVFCGFSAILSCSTAIATEADFYRAAMLIVYAMLFDILDGRVARMTRTQSALGVQLDSLADVMSFGMAPAVLVYRWSLDELTLHYKWAGIVICFIYIGAGTVRLARFNVLAMDTTGKPSTPGKYILGLPIPAAAGIIVSIVVANTVAGRLTGSPIVIAGVVLGLAFLMVSTVRFRSFKDVRPTWRSISVILATIAISLALSIRFHLAYALVWLLGAYIAIGVTESLWNVAQRAKAKRNE